MFTLVHVGCGVEGRKGKATQSKAKQWWERERQGGCSSFQWDKRRGSGRLQWTVRCHPVEPDADRGVTLMIAHSFECVCTCHYPETTFSINPRTPSNAHTLESHPIATALSRSKGTRPSPLDTRHSPHHHCCRYQCVRDKAMAAWEDGRVKGPGSRDASC